MRIITLLTFVFLLTYSSTAVSQDKKPLDHTVYDDWKSLKNNMISNDGNWVITEISPQEGDGKLVLFNLKENSESSIPRGTKAVFSPNSSFLVFHVSPQFDSVRNLKLKKVKKDKLPKDSLGILLTISGDLRKYPDLLKLQVPDEESDWFAFTMKMPENKKDTLTEKKEDKEPDTEVESSNSKGEEKEKKSKSGKKKKEKKKGDLLVIMNPVTGDSVAFENVKKFSLSENGLVCAFVRSSNDSIDSVNVTVFNTVSMKTMELFNNPGYTENISVDKNGKQLAFTYSSDTIKEKAFGLFYYNFKKSKLIPVVDTSFSNISEGWSVSKNGKIYFNDSGSELYFGTAPKPETPAKDTLTKDEKVSVDIWNWKDIKLQPQQLKELDREKKRSYVAVYFTDENKVVQLADCKIKSVSISTKSKGSYSLGYDYEPYTRMTSWEASRYKDVYLLNRKTGEKKLAIEMAASYVVLSPKEDYILWYSIEDSTWNSYDVETCKSINLTEGVKVNFYYELNDIPNEPYPYGFCGWTKKGEPVVYDNYDLWLFDPAGKKSPTNLTGSYGRENKIRFRYQKIDKELQFLPDRIMLSALNQVTFDDGYFTLNMKNQELTKLIMDSYDYMGLEKAKEADKLIWRKQSFKVYPDLYVSNNKFEDIKKLTEANPQQENYIWGDIEIVQWVGFNGDSLRGLLITPENLDPQKKYPMLVYFYERNVSRLNSYSVPKPIRSVINFSYYASNGYIIFIPDIIYRDGYPGPSAYDCIVSGTQDMYNRFGFIDRERIGIQGQSWGGYQVAYLVTQTNMYRAAMAGAPVSNMTSAYGGIRWGSGLSRAFQYEQTQSRIGGDLWDKLPLYMLNSPLFSADRVETPLLMMHNDKDGAVPWYQGIEFFNALRRLDKPVWMLVYNGAPHNLSRRADCKDLTIRMQQFFDHYLKGAPEPVWMKYGVPAIEKGKYFGFELVDPECNNDD